MIILVSICLLVLACAVVLLFAMFAELAARLPRLDVGYRDPSVRALDEVRLGQIPVTWPEPLQQVITRSDPALVLVLSTACSSCEDVALQLSEELDHRQSQDTAVLISCADATLGEDFAQRHGLPRLPYYIDQGGRWVSTTFGVQTSPTALIISKGRLHSALLFAQIAAIRAAMPTQQEVAV